jgi:hypothetical protein
MSAFEPTPPPLFDHFRSRRTRGQRKRLRARRRALLVHAAVARAVRVKARLVRR